MKAKITDEKKKWLKYLLNNGQILVFNVNGTVKQYYKEGNKHFMNNPKYTDYAMSCIAYNNLLPDNPYRKYIIVTESYFFTSLYLDFLEDKKYKDNNLK